MDEENHLPMRMASRQWMVRACCGWRRRERGGGAKEDYGQSVPVSVKLKDGWSGDSLLEEIWRGAFRKVMKERSRYVI